MKYIYLTLLLIGYSLHAQNAITRGNVNTCVPAIMQLKSTVCVDSLYVIRKIRQRYTILHRSVIIGYTRILL